MARRFHPVHVLALALGTTLGGLACDRSGGGDDDVSSRCGTGPSADERAQNQAIFDGLRARCEGCHIMGARGYFASIEAFESLIAYNPDLVVPGKPDDSEFVRLLEGGGAGPFPQMPPAGPTYAELASSGEASLSMAEIRTWVTELGDHAADPRPSASAPRIARLGAAEVQRALYQQLGLSDDDFFIPASNYDIPHKSTGQQDEKYPMSSLDAVPAPFESLPADRFASLGGGSAMYQRKYDPSISPSFAGSLAQIAQRWCAMALDKADNTTLLPGGNTSMVGSTDPAAVKAILRGWFLHFHAVEAADDDVDHVFDALFVPLETETDARAAYVGTCSYFIRHPDWVFH